MAYSEASKRATAKYKAAHYARIIVDVSKEKKERYQTYAAARGLSLTAYICELIEQDNPPEQPKTAEN